MKTESKYQFYWGEFTPENYKDVLTYAQETLLNNDGSRESVDYREPEFFGCVRAGEICVDLSVAFPENEAWLYFDVYVGGVDSGYGYSCREALATGKYANKRDVPVEEMYPYDEADGGAIEIFFGETYDSFKSRLEPTLTEYFDNSRHAANLADKASQPLHKW